MEDNNTSDTKSDRLVAFAEWFLTQPLIALTPPALPVLSQGQVAHVVLYRDNQFQVEQYLLMQKNAVFPPHRHPHVDTIEVDVSGEMLFTVDGVATRGNVTLRIQTPYGDEIQKAAVRIRANQEHWVTVGETGGAFLSIQEWIGVGPTSVVLDWDGPVFSHIHQANLNSIRSKS
jgi:quercetin dioxygenase-like cupin family protein